MKDLSHKACEVLDELLLLTGETNAILAKHDDLAALCCISVATLKKAINELSECNYIQVKGSVHGCQYTINPIVVNKDSLGVEPYSCEYDLYPCKVLVNSADSYKRFEEPLAIEDKK